MNFEVSQGRCQTTSYDFKFIISYQPCSLPSLNCILSPPPQLKRPKQSAFLFKEDVPALLKFVVSSFTPFCKNLLEVQALGRNREWL